MSVVAAWQLIKTFGPWVALALILLAIGVLIIDRNHLAELNNAHQACLTSVIGKPGARPLDETCDKPIAAAAEQALAADACDHALSTGDANFFGSQACSGPTKTLIADREAKASEAANLSGQLSQATTTCNAAVARASARAQSLIQGYDHAQSVLAAAPVGGDGLYTCNADCLRGLGPDRLAHPSPQASDPVVATKVQTRTVCPAELDAPIAPKPVVGDGAVVKYNKAGSDWIAALSAWGDGVVKQLTDAGAACHAAQAAEGAQ